MTMSFRKYYISFAILFQTIVFPSFAEPLFDIKTYSYEDGLSHNLITDIMQDHSGLMWIASWNGIFSFDGYEFTNYRPTPGDGSSMNNARIGVIRESATGNIWCVNQDLKAYLFDVDKETFIDVLMPVEKEMLRKNPVKGIYPLEKGVTWILCENGNHFRVQDSLVPSREAIEVFNAYGQTERFDTVYTVKQDAAGNEYILTNKGVHIIGKGKIDNNYPFHFMEEIGDYIWLASREAYFAKYHKKTEKFSFIDLPDNVKQIVHLHVDADSCISLGTDNGIVFVNTENDEQCQIDVRTSMQTSNAVHHIYKDRHRDYWVFGPWKGVVHISADGRKECLQSPKEAIFNDKATIRFDAFEDVSGYLWILPRDGHLCYYDRKEGCLKNAYVEQGIISAYNVQIPFLPNLRTSYIDKQGNLWTAVSSSVDLCRMSFFEKDFEWQRGAQKGADIRAVYLDKKGRKWVADKNGLLAVYERDGSLRYLSGDGRWHSLRTPFGHNVYSIMEDHSGNLWIGTRNHGLYRMQPQADGNYRSTHYMPDENDIYSMNGLSVYSILQDSHGHIWVGTYEGGLNLVEEDGNQRLRFIHKGNRLKNFVDISRVRHIIENKDGVLLLATSEGLVTFSSDFIRPEEIVLYVNSRRPDDARSLSGNELMYIYEDSRHDIWLLTQNAGANKILSDKLLSDKLEMEVYNEKSGLASDLTLCMMEDGEGMLWMVSKYTLSRFNPTEGSFENFGKYNFRETLFFSEASILCDEEGFLNIGTDKGLLRFSPKSMKKEQYVPDLILTGLGLQNESIDRNPDRLECLELTPPPIGICPFRMPLSITRLREISVMPIKWKDWTRNGLKWVTTVQRNMPTCLPAISVSCSLLPIAMASGRATSGGCLLW